MRVSGNRRPRGGRPNSGGGRSGPSGGRGGQGGNRRPNNGNRSYDSNGPDGKIRGSATQVYDKYISLGRDAQTSGDHVGAENHYQHAEHYYRIMLANNLVKPDRPAEQSSSEDDATSDVEAETVQLDKAAEKNTKMEMDNDSDVPTSEKEPIIIDLSNPEEDEMDAADADEVSETVASPQDEEEAVVEAADDDEDGEAKPKSKRRVSRTRGLRRRTSRRNTESADSDEPQSAE